MSLLLNDQTQAPYLAPVVAQACVNAAAAVGNEIDRAAYIVLLRGMDWSAEFSDDGRAVERARTQLARIRAMQPQVDPDRVLYEQMRSREHGAMRL